MSTLIVRREGRATKNRARRVLLVASAFLAPFLILSIVFQYGPLLMLARDSLFSYRLTNPDARTFVGLDNFIRVFTDATTLQSLFVTLLFALGVVVLTIPLAFLLANFLNSKLPARGFVRTLVFLPVVTSAVVVATLWTFLLNNNGLVNSVLAGFGLGPFDFLTDKSQALPAIIIMSVWQQIGLAAVMYLGGLQAIPGDVVEASMLDGAGPVRRMISVTIPLMSRTTVLVVVVMTVFALQSFAPAYVMTAGAPEGTTNTLVYHIYKTAFNLQQPGYASAISVVLLLIAIIISLVQMRLLRTRWDY
jgi:multiple sugar transport system permease protein